MPEKLNRGNIKHILFFALILLFIIVIFITSLSFIFYRNTIYHISIICLWLVKHTCFSLSTQYLNVLSFHICNFSFFNTKCSQVAAIYTTAVYIYMTILLIYEWFLVLPEMKSWCMPTDYVCIFI